MRSRSVIYLALAAGVFMLSASGVFAKVARAPAGIIAFYRLFFATLALLPWLLSHKNDRRELRSLRFNMRKARWPVFFSPSIT